MTLEVRKVGKETISNSQEDAINMQRKRTNTTVVAVMKAFFSLIRLHYS